jgi:hypothetical protein
MGKSSVKKRHLLSILPIAGGKAALDIRTVREHTAAYGLKRSDSKRRKIRDVYNY